MFEFLFLFVSSLIMEIVDAGLGMGYGTVLSPFLISSGFDPLDIVPALLFSQAIGGFTAAVFHHRHKNVNFTRNSEDTKIAVVITFLGVLATILSVFIAVNISKFMLKTYIGILVLAMGLVILSGYSFKFRLRKMVIVGIISSFNKGLSGGGFGPVVTGGQIIGGKEIKSSIGVTTLAEAPVCIAGFLSYVAFNGIPSLSFLIPLSIGAVIAAPFGARVTKKIAGRRSKKILGVIIAVLGLYTLLQTWGLLPF